MPDQKKVDDDASIALMSKRFKKVAEVIGTEKAVAVLNARSASRQDPRFGEAIFPVWGNVSPFGGMSPRFGECVLPRLCWWAVSPLTPHCLPPEQWG